ncbi:hypothetical protein NKG05_19015 [Oerskovia sp. M15]
MWLVIQAVRRSPAGSAPSRSVRWVRAVPSAPRALSRYLAGDASGRPTSQHGCSRRLAAAPASAPRSPSRSVAPTSSTAFPPRACGPAGTVAAGRRRGTARRTRVGSRRAARPVEPAGSDRLARAARGGQVA